jgi:signal transduction histidine kinase
MRARSWPVLIFGFGTLIVLIVLAGLGAAQRAQQIQTEMSSAHDLYRSTAKVFNEIHSGIHLSGIFVRDYLLDPSHLTASLHKEQLLDIRSTMSKELDELDRLVGPEERKALNRLRGEIDAYWSSLEPIFEWTPQQKLALSSLFLRQHVLPRRDAVLALAREIEGLNQANFQRQQQRLSRSQQDFRSYLWWMMGIAVSLGALVAATSIYRTTRLEKNSEEQQKRTERAEQELRRLSQQLVQAQEAERKSLSRELHDEVGQMLTALRMDLGRLSDSRSAPPEEFNERLEEVKRVAEQTLAAVRSLAMGLRPAMLDDLGLGPALEWQGREFSRRSSIPVTVQIDGVLDGLPDSHRTCVFRVVQEALTNCARHAQAKNIRITVHGRQDAVFVTVQDDGVGMSRDQLSTGGLGLIGIEERSRELGGNVAIYSQPGKGTTLKVEIPLGREVAL